MFTEFTTPLGQSQHRFVIAGLTRNPGLVWHWIPDVETPDLIRGRDDSIIPTRCHHLQKSR